MIYKIINFILLVAISIILCSCNGSKSSQHNNNLESKKVEIAILMPTSSLQGVLGAEYAKLIKMGIEDGLQGNISITTYDIPDESNALSAMNKIIAKNTKIILGPLTSNLTSVIASKAKSAGIIVITMSNNPVLAGEKLYVFGHAPSKQLKPLFNYFFENNYKNFITLLPAGSHSQNVNKIIQNSVIQNHGTLARSEFYTESSESITNAIKIISDSVDNINEIEDEHLHKIVVYLGDDPEALKTVFDTIHALNLDKKAIIAGDNRIDIGSAATSIIFTGSLNILNHNLAERIQNSGIPHLTFMHALSYDLGKLTAEYIGKDFNEASFVGRLNSSARYNGISGKIYFIDNIAQREYDIISKEDGNYKALSHEIQK